MKALQGIFEIRFNWYREDNKHINPEHVEALQETAQESIFKQISDGEFSGELSDNIHMEGDPEEGVSYLGDWSYELLKVDGDYSDY